MGRKASLSVILVLSLVLMTSWPYAQQTGEKPQGMMGPGMMGPGMMGSGTMGQGMMGQGMMGMCPMCGGMMGRGMGGMMGDPACQILREFGGPGFYDWYAQQLDLSEEQRTQLKAIWLTHLKSVIQRRADIQIAQLELREELGKDVPDYNQAKAKISQINALRGGIAQDHLSAIKKARKLLTPEQLKKLKSLRMMPMGGPQGMMPVPREEKKQQGMMGGGMHR